MDDDESDLDWGCLGFEDEGLVVVRVCGDGFAGCDFGGGRDEKRLPPNLDADCDEEFD